MGTFLAALYLFAVVLIFIELYRMIFKQWKKKEEDRQKRK